VATEIILRELLQGFAGPDSGKEIIERFSALPLIAPDRQDPIGVAAQPNPCRRAEAQVGTIDALPARLRVRHELAHLTTDKDFAAAAARWPLRLWQEDR